MTSIARTDADQVRLVPLGTEHLPEVALPISVGNQESSRVAKRAGYRLDGVLRSLYTKPGVRSDTEVWSLLPSDESP